MAARWTVAFVLAAWLAVGGNAVLRRRARDARQRSESWAMQLRQLGGVVVAGAALVASVGSMTAAGLFAVSGADDAVTSTACVAVAGACLGVLVFNARPASTQMGPPGSTFVGFVLAVLVVAFTPNTTSPGHLLVPVLMFAIPVLDLLIVTASRLWRGVPLSRSRRDHLVHRLRSRGWSRGRALTAVLVAHGLLVGAAVLVGRDALSPAFGLFTAAIVGTALLAGRGATTDETGPKPRNAGRI